MPYSKQRLTSTTSTNEVLKENASFLPHFHFLRADYQSKGKGRENRIWTANPAQNLLFSVLLKDENAVKLGGKLSLIAASCIARVFEEKYGLQGVSIKWPNDIYVDGKKCVGILLEGRMPEFIIIGMGINANQTSFEGEYRHTPTSLSLELGTSVDIDELESYIEDALYDALSSRNIELKPYLDYFATHDYLKGKRGLSKSLNQEGVILGVDEDFNLLLQVDEKTLSLSAGEVDLLD